MTKIALGVLCYNEADVIERTLREMAAQDVWHRDGWDVSLIAVPNGCSDDTAGIAQRVLDNLGHVNGTVREIAEGGKANAWNAFVHEMTPADADYLVLTDADIGFRDETTISRLIDALEADGELEVATSMASKDLAFRDHLTLKQKLILKGGAGADELKHSIAGSLYAARSERLRRIWMPKGLPVEDGYLRAMVLTDGFRGPEVFERILKIPGVAHVFTAVETLKELFRHQERIIVGSAINAHLFDYLRTLAPETDRVSHLRQKDETEPGWLGDWIRRNHQDGGQPWVHRHFLYKRWLSFGHKSGAERLKSLPMMVAGTGADAFVYLRARQRMANGTALGFW